MEFHPQEGVYWGFHLLEDMRPELARRLGCKTDRHLSGLENSKTFHDYLQALELDLPV